MLFPPIAKTLSDADIVRKHWPVEPDKSVNLYQLDEWCQKMQAAGCRSLVLVGAFSACPNADEETRDVLAKCDPYWAAGREVIENHGGLFINVGPYL